MTQIWIVRHGEAAASWEKDPDPGLSALGQEQAERTAQALLEIVPEDATLLSSPLKRAQETAAAFAEKRGASVTIDPRFSEVRSPVPLSGRKAWLQAFMQQDWSEQSADLWEWRNGIVAGLKACEVYPANASYHELALVGGELSLVQLGAQMETRVN